MNTTHRPPEFRNKALILGVSIDNISLDETMTAVERFLLSKSQHKIFTPNPEICLKAEKDDDYRNILNNADLNIPDGFGLSLGAKILGEKLDKRVTGVDLSKKILEKCNTDEHSVYILSRNDSLTKKADLDQLFKKQYPNIDLKTSLIDKDHPYDCDDNLNDIIDFQPKVLLVTIGAPAQEIWISKYLKFFPSVKVALGVGGTFDFLTGKMKRAPESMRNLGLEWLYRLYQEPKRIGRIRDAVVNFLLVCIHWKNRMATVYRANVLGVITDGNGNFLIQKNSRLTNHWQFPQGGIDEGESAEEAVVREVSEELGIDRKYLKISRQLPAEHSYEWPRHSQLLRGFRGQKQVAYLLKFVGNNSNIDYKNSHEVEDIKWVTKDKLLESLHPVRREFIAKIINEI